jgi:hypothetical protein
MFWCVHNPDGSKKGPLRTDELIHGLVDGSISGLAWVRRPEDPTWQPVTSVEAFSEIADPDDLGDSQPSHLGMRLALVCCAVAFAFAVGAIGL